MSAPATVKIRRSICWLLAVLPLALFGQQTTTFNFNNVNVAIPDYDPNNPQLVQSSETISGLSGNILSIQVGLNLAGTPVAFNSDYYVELVNGAGGFAVLLNRVGESSSNPFGYGDNGFNVTFSDAATNDIHFYQNDSDSFNPNGQLTGTWQPDGENISPASDPSAFDNAANQQTAMLSSFIGDSPDDTWTLFLADLAQGGTGQVSSWSLAITTTPEPTTASFLIVGLICLGIGFRRKQKRLSSRG